MHMQLFPNIILNVLIFVAHTTVNVNFGESAHANVPSAHVKEIVTANADLAK